MEDPDGDTVIIGAKRQESREFTPTLEAYAPVREGQLRFASSIHVHRRSVVSLVNLLPTSPSRSGGGVGNTRACLWKHC